MDNLTNYHYYDEMPVYNRVMGMILHRPDILRVYHMAAEDFRYDENYFKTIEQCQSQGVQTVTKDVFLSAYEQVAYDAEREGAATNELLAKAERFYNDCWQFGATVGQENIEADYLLLKKYSLMHRLQAMQCDVSYYYKPQEKDTEKHMERMKRFLAADMPHMLHCYTGQWRDLERQYDLSNDVTEEHVSKNAEALLESYEAGNQYGLGMASSYLNTVTAGMLPGKLIITSASTNAGKTRLGIADICHAFMPCRYESSKKMWVKNPAGGNNRALFIATETTADEIKTSMFAYAAEVEENHIKFNRYEASEKDRVRLAKNMFYRSGIWIAYMPEPTVAKLEDCVRRYVTRYGITHVFFDYIQSNAQLLAEFAGEIKGAGAYREDQALANCAKNLRTFAVKYNVFVQTYTQVNAEVKNGRFDENAIRGARAIADKADAGIVMRKPEDEEVDKVHATFEKPNLVLECYKNRGKERGIRIWLHFNYGTLRITDCCVTNLKCERIPGFESTYIERNAKGELVVRLNQEPCVPLSEDEYHSLLVLEPTKEEQEGKALEIIA